MKIWHISKVKQLCQFWQLQSGAALFCITFHRKNAPHIFEVPRYCGSSTYCTLLLAPFTVFCNKTHFLYIICIIYIMYTMEIMMIKSFSLYFIESSKMFWIDFFFRSVKNNPYICIEWYYLFSNTFFDITPVFNNLCT